MLVLHALPEDHRAARWVRYAWEWEGYASPSAVERILPHGSAEITWNLAAPHRFYEGAEARTIPHAALVGVRDTPYGIDTRQKAHLLTLAFQPGAATRLFGVSMEELCGSIVPLSHFRVGAELEERIGNARDASERFRTITRFFASLPAIPRNREALHVLRAWSTPRGRTRSVASLRTELGLSSPTFVQRLREQLGFRPSQLRQVLMFRDAVQGLAHGKVSLARAAQDLGYCDQAHLARVFRDLAGFSPSRFRPLLPDHPFNVAEPATRAVTALSLDPRRGLALPAE